MSSPRLRLSGYIWLVLLVFLTTALPLSAFSIFLALYFCASFLRSFLWPSAVERCLPVMILNAIPGTSDLFWSSSLLLLLPYVLFGIAVLLQASSSSIIHLGTWIPHQNAAIAFALECVWLCSRWIKWFQVTTIVGFTWEY